MSNILYLFKSMFLSVMNNSRTVHNQDTDTETKTLALVLKKDDKTNREKL